MFCLFVFSNLKSNPFISFTCHLLHNIFCFFLPKLSVYFRNTAEDKGENKNVTCMYNGDTVWLRTLRNTEWGSKDLPGFLQRSLGGTLIDLQSASCFSTIIMTLNECAFQVLVAISASGTFSSVPAAEEALCDSWKIRRCYQ